MLKGKLTFTSNKLDVTDPCYDRDVVLRTTVDIDPGVYDYEIIIDGSTGWGDRCKSISIKKEGCGKTRRGPAIGAIGVDAGLAGFFENKPDYDCDAWDKICESLHGYPRVIATDQNNKEPFGCECVFCSSGFGDGYYTVSSLLNFRGQVVGYEITFF